MISAQFCADPPHEGLLARHGVLSETFYENIYWEEGFVEIFSPCHDAGADLDEFFLLSGAAND